MAFRKATDTKPFGVVKLLTTFGRKTKSHLVQFVQTT
jgi:hypothetical protein